MRKLQRPYQLTIRVNAEERDIVWQASAKARASLRYTLLQLCRAYIAGSVEAFPPAFSPEHPGEGVQ